MPTSTDYIDRVNCYFISLRFHSERDKRLALINLATSVRSPKVNLAKDSAFLSSPPPSLRPQKQKQKTKQKSQDSALSYFAFHSSA